MSYSINPEIIYYIRSGNSVSVNNTLLILLRIIAPLLLLHSCLLGDTLKLARKLLYIKPVADNEN
ncbi:hypothetical protein [Listeria cornellensis]|uniref:Uncharacterized protein n=1 Tax=Listeria cornellensis FSL F6-0969 TaxID=1265820 RepID=W7C331_9LIST|nr:hypothetical protein [Listeria cornellensis]EUJ31482.1 hypothetical protein PCORN_05521 [Listeria cornellensis FSL F6-0969]